MPKLSPTNCKSVDTLFFASVNALAEAKNSLSTLFTVCRSLEFLLHLHQNLYVKLFDPIALLQFLPLSPPLLSPFLQDPLPVQQATLHVITAAISLSWELSPASAAISAALSGLICLIQVSGRTPDLHQQFNTVVAEMSCQAATSQIMA